MIAKFTLAVLAASAAASTVLLAPPTGTTGEDIAIVWIQGALCANTAYTEIAQQIQTTGAANGQRIFVGIPQFISGAPDPVTISGKFTKTLSSLQDMGFTGDNIVIAGHSLGGVMAQNYAESNTDIKAQVLMGSTLTRDKHSLNEDGTTHFDYTVPSLTLGGTKDGLMRITRVTEQYWNGVQNIESDQVGMFPTVTLEGVSHMGFLSGDAPLAVRIKDLTLDVTEDEAHTMSAEAMVAFFDGILLGNTVSYNMKPTETITTPIIQGMEMEGFYKLKDPCYYSPTVGPTDDPTCWHGAKWHDLITQQTMAGDLGSDKTSVKNDDNFHEVADTNPIHLPSITTTCDVPSVTCAIESITVSQNIYNAGDDLDTGYTPIAATEMKTKLTSRQNFQEHAGNTDADFSVTDETGSRCAEINQKAIEWAYAQLSKTQKNLYDSLGVQMVVGDDMGPYNAGPLWIWTLMDYTKDLDARTMTVSAPMMRTPTSYFIGSAAGFHYCKVLSPFAALEWMLVDGLHDFDGINNSSETLFLQ